MVAASTNIGLTHRGFREAEPPAKRRVCERSTRPATKPIAPALRHDTGTVGGTVRREREHHPKAEERQIGRPPAGDGQPAGRCPGGRPRGPARARRNAGRHAPRTEEPGAGTRPRTAARGPGPGARQHAGRGRGRPGHRRLPQVAAGGGPAPGPRPISPAGALAGGPGASAGKRRKDGICCPPIAMGAARPHGAEHSGVKAATQAKRPGEPSHHPLDHASGPTPCGHLRPPRLRDPRGIRRRLPSR